MLVRRECPKCGRENKGMLREFGWSCRKSFYHGLDFKSSFQILNRTSDLGYILKSVGRIKQKNFLEHRCCGHHVLKDADIR